MDRPALDEIEVTDAMRRAGADAIGYDDQYVLEETAEKVFQAMMAARETTERGARP